MVPSLCAPITTAGWKKTFYGYFEEDVGLVLSNVVAALEAKPSRRFIWSEVSYLAAWVDADPAARQPRVQRLVDRGQLEFVGASPPALESTRVRRVLSRGVRGVPRRALRVRRGMGAGRRHAQYARCDAGPAGRRCEVAPAQVGLLRRRAR